MGTKGGKTRAQIIKNVKKTPQNANQLATMLKLDYKTIRHHLTILEKNKIIVPVGDHYSTVYFLSQPMEENYRTFEELNNKIKERYSTTARTSNPKMFRKNFVPVSTCSASRPQISYQTVVSTNER